MARIVISLGNKVFKERNLDKEVITLGRDASNDIQIDNLAISNSHLKIVTSDSGSVLIDLDSTNGTAVNGKKISQHSLQDKDIVQVGKYTIQYSDDQEVLDALLSKKKSDRNDVIKSPITSRIFGDTLLLRYRHSKIALFAILLCLVGTIYTAYRLTQLKRFVINPQFDAVTAFREGLAAVRVGDDETGKWGFIDKQGNMVIPPHFDSVRAFREGRAAVRIGYDNSGKWGYIDKQGDNVIDRQFDTAFGFTEGLAAVRNGDYTTGKVSFIDKQGKIAINLQFNYATRFSEGLAAVAVDERRFGFIDRRGAIVIPPQFDDAWGFQEGLAAVRFGSAAADKWGFINRQGKMVIAPMFDPLTAVVGFKEGRAVVRMGDDETGRRVGFIDTQGKMVISTQFGEADSFSEGLAAVRVGDDKTGKWGFIDKQGKMVISTQFGKADSFSEGLAAVRVGDEKTGKWGFIGR
ncbi:MAG: WG repeat-containing protein [Candidatus Accumulibacter phosphatis]|uniref:WG repeat-containing protein n=1 Tax=Candidatus Accumulibacter phosphatis TaxID=327160 RepID=UPI001A4DF80D|nr:WG repeat-containing protein [Candidatus Accumulibacter phosphatis]